MLNILITGAGGQLGNEMRILGAASQNRYIYTDIAELDITDVSAVDAFIRDHGIDIIVNCAAYTNVEKAESNEPLAAKINCTAVKNLAVAAARYSATLIHISTDYVFDGNGNIPYNEEAPTAPLGAYGRTKFAGEEAVKASGCKYLIFRTSWLYSEFGNNFLKTMMRLLSERPSVKVVFDQVGTPTYAADLAYALFRIIEENRYEGKEGIYHFSDEGVCSWYDFAREIATAMNRSVGRVLPCHTSEFPTEAERPHYSVLDKSKYKAAFDAEIPHWRTSMLECIAKIKKQNSI